MRKTKRGFGIYSEFLDTYKNTIRIQESSAAIKPCCWIFCKDLNGNDGEYDKATQEWVSATPHLTRAQAKRVAKALLKFVEDTK